MSRSKAPKAKVRAKKRGKAAPRLSIGLGHGRTLLLNVASGLTLLWVVLGLFDGTLWLGALSRELTPLLLGLCVLLAALAGLERRYLLVGLLSLGCALMVTEERALLRPVKLTPAKGPLLRVVHATLDGSAVQAQRASELVRETRPDVFSALGLTPATERVFNAAFSTWPAPVHGLGPARDGTIWSRLPLRGTAKDGALRLRVGRCDVQLALADVSNLTQLSMRKTRAERIAALSGVQNSARAVWLGHFGSRPQAADLAALLQAQHLRDTRLGHGFLATEPAWLGLFGLSTDHVLLRGWIAVRERSLRAPLGPAAHQTLVSTLELTEPRCQN